MSNDKQQTAVEWLVNQMIESYYLTDESYYDFEKAKAMEKEQRMSDFTMGITNANRMEATKDAEQWYNEIYGDNK